MIVASVKGIPWSTFELTWCPCQPFLWYLCQRMEESCKILRELIIILRHFSKRWKHELNYRTKLFFIKTPLWTTKQKKKNEKNNHGFLIILCMFAHNMTHALKCVIETHPSVTANPWVCLEQYPYPLTALDLKTRTRTRTRFSVYYISSACARTNVILAGKCGSHCQSTASFSENVVVAKTSYQNVRNLIT